MSPHASLFYHSIAVRGRGNVREPLDPPRLRLVRPSGKLVVVNLNEPQLLAILREATAALEVCWQRRHATVPVFKLNESATS